MPLIDRDIESNDEELEDEQDEVDDEEEGEDISDDQEEVEELSDDGQEEAEEQSDDHVEIEEQSDDHVETEEQSDDHVEIEEQSDDQGETEDQSDDADEYPDADEEVDDEQESDPSENSSSESRAIQVEPDDDASEDPDASEEEVSDDEEEESDTTEPPNNGDTVIQMEPDDEEKPPRRRRRRPKKAKKEHWDIFFLICSFLLAIGVIGGIVYAVYYFGTRPLTCLPAQRYKWLKDVSKGNDTDFQNSLFNGLVTHSRMYSICDRIEKQGRSLRNDTWYGAVYLRNSSDEELFDKQIRAHMSEIFGGLPNHKKLMWTGFKYEWNNSTQLWDWKSPTKTIGDYQKFCDQTNWKEELLKRQDDSAKGDIFIVKDYGKTDACWQAYNSTQLAGIMGQASGTIPRLSFACESNKHNLTSGNDAMPGFFYPKHHKKDKFWVYGVSATIEDAKSECESKGSTLVTIDTLDKLNEVEHDALWDTAHYTDLDRFWTGGYLDISHNNTRNFKWHSGSPYKTQYSRDLFANITIEDLDAAIKKLSTSVEGISKDQLRDCGKHDYLYLGLYHPRVKDLTGREDGERGLTILNQGGSLDQDNSNFYVLCEKKSG